MIVLLPTPRSRTQGNALLVTLLVTLLLGAALTSYLMLLRSAYATTARSQAWHQSLALAEAGVEEALAQLNPHAFASNLACGDGWSLSDDGWYQPDPPQRTLLGGRYAVTYTPDVPPTIYATGYVALPSGTTLSRAVRVTTTNAALYPAGLSIETLSNPSRYPFYLDTFDSSNPLRVGDDEDDGEVYRMGGYILTNVALLRHSELPDVPPPFATGWTLPTKDHDTYTLSGNYFFPGNLHIPGHDRLYVPPYRTAVIYVVGDFSMSTNAEIEIAATGSLKLYVSGRQAQIDYVNNQGKPQNFQVYGLPGNTNVLFTQITPKLVGAIYAPEATFAATTGNSTFDFYGSLVARELRLTRPIRFHFDENLARNGPRRGFVANSWREL